MEGGAASGAQPHFSYRGRITSYLYNDNGGVIRMPI
jgi:hypothetical protein